ncbi:TniQ family protein [Kitasatospora sp. NPDC087314]|uniref:TniQ family protein n=1 Tax=Kitasatospora sp. NPDC087314 TaxID=3364068 RepID=UPI003830EE3C
MSPAARVLPLRVAPLDGESIDSWLHALARRYGITVRRLLSVLGLPSPVKPQELLTEGPPEDLRRLEMLAALPTGRLDSTVPSATWFPGRPRTRTPRYCPPCLADRGGRFRLSWWSPWTFACTQHRLLLADRCPTCHTLPHQRMPLPSPPGICAAPQKRQSHCITNLTTVPVTELSPSSPLLDTQHWIDAVTAGGADRTAAEVFNDLEYLANWLQRTLDERDTADLDPIAAEGWKRRPTAASDAASSTWKAQLTAPVAAVVAREGQTLICADDQHAIDRLRILNHRRPNGLSTRPHTMDPRHFAMLSPALQSRFIRAADAGLEPTSRIRLRSCTSTARLPRTDEPASRARLVPQLLWPDWTLRILPETMRPELFRAVASALVLHVGQPEHTIRSTVQHLHPHIGRYLLATTLQDMIQAGNSPLLEVFCRIADFLDSEGSPIDYHRRRELVTADILAEDDWMQLCYRTGTNPGEHGPKAAPTPRFRQAQRYLVQLMTGDDLSAPIHPLTWTKRGERARYFQSIESFPPAQRHALREHGCEALRTLGIDEPLTWSPPDHICHDIRLPGPRLDDIDLKALHRLVHRESVPVVQAAAALRTNHTHVRFALDLIEPKRPRRGEPTTRGSTWKHRERARTLLTADFFQREYVMARKNAGAIAKEHGLPRDIVVEFAHDAGFTRHHSPRPVDIDPAWLRDQYVNHKRSTLSLAEEIGTEDMTILRRLRQLDIPIRPSGVHSSEVMLAQLPDDAPADIKKAVQGTRYGWLRLARFQAAIEFPNLKLAGEALGIVPSALVTQLARLEADIGAPLFHRSAKTKNGTPMSPTQRGAELLAALARADIQALAPPGEFVLHRENLKWTTSRLDRTDDKSTGHSHKAPGRVHSE